MNLDLRYYLSVLIRRSPYIIVVTALFASIGLTVAIILPSEFEAKATLLVEAEQIPQNLASSTVSTNAGEQLRIIEQRLLSRQNLLDVSRRLGLHRASVGANEISVAEIVGDMRSRLTFRQVGGGGRRASDAATILEISYRGRSPSQVAQIANEFVTLVLQENLEIRTEQAGDTLAFFTQEVERLGGELDAQSVRLIQFQNEAGIATPDNLAFLRGRLDALQLRRATARRDIVALEDQKNRLSELFRVTASAQEVSARSPLEQALLAAQQQLADAQVVYSDQNPRVSMLRARVEQLTEQVARTAALELAETEGDGGADATDGTSAAPLGTEREVRFQAELDQIDRKIETLRAEIVTIGNSLEAIEAQIAEAPSNGVSLGKLQRDYENVQSQYNQAVSRLSVAATGERIELLSKGQRISVIEQAVPPDRPTKPNRPIIAAASVGAGLMVGLALIALLEFLNRSIRRPIELTNRLGITPLAVIPYIRTQKEIALRRTIIFGTVGGLTILVPLALFTVHSFVFPLDTIIESLFNRVGFSVIG